MNLTVRIFLVLMIPFLTLSCSNRKGYTPAPYDGSRATIDVSGLPERDPAFYSVTIENTRVDFFLIRIGDDVRSYFDACKQCYRKRLGFRYENGRMVCKYCNVSYPIEDLKTGLGGCYPIRLKGSRQNGTFTITKEAFESGLQYF